MDSRQLIDAQFDRAVEIVQGLPKTGPIQTGYEEKLTMYSLYKQATVGNVTGPRPGIFDMLGRAKWDAWAKHKDLDQYEAKWLYVDALLKALSKYSDKTVAKDLIDELQSYGGDPGNLVSSHTLTRAGSRGSSSSNSTAAEENSLMPASLSNPLVHDFQHSLQHLSSDIDDDDSEDEEAVDQTGDLPVVRDAAQQQRPPSSLSSRYRTPVAGSYVLSPPARRLSVPPTQPLPNFEMPSAFADPQPTTSLATPSGYPSSTPHPETYPSFSRDLAPQVQAATPLYKSHPSVPRHYATTGTPMRPPSGALSVSLEHAMENMQAHLAALTERIDTLESSIVSRPRVQSSTSPPSRNSSGRGSPANPCSIVQGSEWDIEDMGLWALILKPLVHNFSFLRRFLLFFLTSGQDRSPLMIVVRRLCLDLSFVMVALGILRRVWVVTGTRRRDVWAALIVLSDAIRGKKSIPGGKYLRM